MIKQFLVIALCCSVGYGAENTMKKMEISDAQPIQKLSLALPSFVDTLAADPSVQSAVSLMETELSGKTRAKAAEMKIQATTDDFSEEATVVPTLVPTFAPTNLPPTASPSVVPTTKPSTHSPSSVDPSAAPVENPTFAPSAVAHDDKWDDNVEGYVSYEYWNEAQCGGQKTYQSGVKTDTCFRLGRLFSFKVQMSDDQCTNLHLELYLDTTCTTKFTDLPLKVQTQCTDLYPNTYASSYQMMCSVGSTPLVDTTSTLEGYFTSAASSNQCGSSPFQFNAYTNNLCLNYYGASEVITCDATTGATDTVYGNRQMCSLKLLGALYSYPLTCSAVTTSAATTRSLLATDKSESAVAVLSETYTAAPVYYQLSCNVPLPNSPSQKPTTRMPSVVPTLYPTILRPTVAPTVVGQTNKPTGAKQTQFKVTITIHGVYYATYISNTVIYNLAISLSVSACISSDSTVTASAMTVAPGSSAVRKLRAIAFASSSLESEDPDTVKVSFLVSSASSASYETLAAELQQSVHSGAFNQYMGSFGQQVGATGLMGAQAVHATTEEVAVTNSVSSGGSGSSSLSVGVISGVAIGGFVCLCLILMYAYYRQTAAAGEDSAASDAAVKQQQAAKIDGVSLSASPMHAASTGEVQLAVINSDHAV